MGVPQTLPADFQGWDKAAAPPATLPADFDKWDAKQKTESTRPDQFAQDRAVTEAWAQDHPIFGPIARFLVSAGQNAATTITNTPAALYHAIVDPPTLDEATLTPEQRVISRLGVRQAAEAAVDYATGKVTAKGAASVLPEALGTGLGQVAGGAVYGKLGETGKVVVENGAPVIKSIAPYAEPIAKAVWKTVDTVTFDRLGKIWDAWKGLPEEIRAKGPQFHDPGAPLPDSPPPELLQARTLATGGRAPQPEQAAALGSIPQRYTPELPAAFQPLAPRAIPPIGTVDRPFIAPAPGSAGSLAASVAEPAMPAPLSEVAGQGIPRTVPAGEGIPRTLSGESILGQVLGGRDQATLLRIARSRGINVSQEAQLKAGVANKRIIGKIIDDFSPEELEEVRAQGMENSRFRHAFGDIGEEAWNTMALQTYFPDIRIPVAQLLRTQKAIQTAGQPKFGPLENLGAQIKESAAQ